MCQIAIDIPNEVLYDTRMSKEKFVRYLGDNKVSVFHYDDEDEFLEELNNA